MHDRMREPERKVELVTLRLRAVSDADQGEFPLESLGYAGDHVGGQGPHRSGHCIAVLGAFDRFEEELVALALYLNLLRQLLRKRPERTLDRDRVCAERDFHAFRHGDRGFSYARHDQLS